MSCIIISRVVAIGNDYTVDAWEQEKTAVTSLILRALERCVRVNSTSDGLTGRVQASGKCNQ